MAADDHLLTGAYALDALDDEGQRDAVERHLTDCPECRDEVRSLRDTAARLAEPVAQEPSPALRDRLLAQIAATPQLPAPGVVPLPVAPAPGRRPAGRLLAVAAGVVLVAGVGLGAVGTLQWRQAGDAQARAERIVQIVGDPGASRVSAPVTGGGTATVIVAGSRAVLATSGVPGLDADRQYQVWLVRGSGTVSAGLGPQGAAAAGTWSREVDGVRPGDAVAVSVEPAGGSDQPTTTPVTVVKA